MLTRWYLYDTILPSDSNIASTYFFVPYYPFGNHGGNLCKTLLIALWERPWI